MSLAKPVANDEAPRVPTGNPELDEMLHGGLLPHRPYLIIGPSGTGKTTLALRYLCEGVRRGEEALLVTLEEPPNEMRFNHLALGPELDRVWVFDAIPDVMRYERAPFKDVAQARDSVRFQQVAPEIRKTPELSSVEITLTALEQTLRMQMARRSYRRIAIDSLTALQYFCMKGLDEVQGAQSFLRFLSELGATTLLTMESGVEELDAPERMLARGEIRLFRWEDEGRTVRAIGVEKFRGSAHDNRLHPYRIGPHGMDIRLGETISRDPRRRPPTATEIAAEEHVAPLVVTVGEPPAKAMEPALVDPVGPWLDGIAAELAVLRAAHLDLGAVRGRLEAALGALKDGDDASARAALDDTGALVRQMRLGLWSARADRRPAVGSEPSPTPAPSPYEPSLRPLSAPEMGRMIEGLSSVLGTATEGLGPEAATGGAEAGEPPAPPQGFEFHEATTARAPIFGAPGEVSPPVAKPTDAESSEFPPGSRTLPPAEDPHPAGPPPPAIDIAIASPKPSEAESLAVARVDPAPGASAVGKAPSSSSIPGSAPPIGEGAPEPVPSEDSHDRLRPASEIPDAPGAAAPPADASDGPPGSGLPAPGESSTSTPSDAGWTVGDRSGAHREAPSPDPARAVDGGPSARPEEERSDRGMSRSPEGGEAEVASPPESPRPGDTGGPAPPTGSERSPEPPAIRGTESPTLPFEPSSFSFGPTYDSLPSAPSGAAPDAPRPPPPETAAAAPPAGTPTVPTEGSAPPGGGSPVTPAAKKPRKTPTRRRRVASAAPSSPSPPPEVVPAGPSVAPKPASTPRRRRSRRPKNPVGADGSAPGASPGDHPDLPVPVTPPPPEPDPAPKDDAAPEPSDRDGGR